VALTAKQLAQSKILDGNYHQEAEKDLSCVWVGLHKKVL
jgi:hypothetical protein